ncbi:hypothetical protein OBBRIDRAFT_804980 [Obba rivulosa]|uniref:Uncharacterized protein n=1 Tax=Obba rivulosa TaxID=1052685 RepID=A0A8E2DJ84_9APHY|nr:hypothetical protein OBBRIDRAFT_804980 [Obba rivulosa]
MEDIGRQEGVEYAGSQEQASADETVPEEWLGYLPQLDALQYLSIGDNPNSDFCETSIPLLRPVFFAAASRFQTVTSLVLSRLVFWNFSNLARLICGFSRLLRLELHNVSWHGGEGRSLFDERFARSLRLQYIKICGSGLSKYKKLLSAPELLRDVEILDIDISSTLVESEEVISRMTITLNWLHSDGPPRTVYEDHPALRASLRSTFIAIVRLWELPIEVPFSGYAPWLLDCSNLLDGFLASLDTLGFSSVDLELMSINPEVVDTFCVNANLFPALRALGILEVTAMRHLGGQEWEPAEDLVLRHVPAAGSGVRFKNNTRSGSSGAN